jgi:carotenoid 1,2-hydratase
MDGVVSAAGIGDENSGPLSGGRLDASGRGRADGGAVGAPGRAAPRLGPRFDAPVPPGGYLWWYLDGISGDGRHAITLIAFVGSVFSPYYAWSGRGDPLNHCAVNVALYGKPGARWAMTERGRRAVVRSERRLQIGPSSLQWQGGTLKIDVDEIGAPIPKRIRGTIRVTPSAFIERSFTLDAAGNHIWQPIAPMARIEVALDHPDLNWSGSAYLDSNFGAEPLETEFKNWTWSRAHLKDDAVVLYDAARRDGTQASLALRFGPDGGVTPEEPPPLAALAPTGWRIARETRADIGQPVRVEKTLEDTPFYARTLLETQLYGERAQAFHESLSLDRVASPIVRAMLPFRMPRRFG